MKGVIICAGKSTRLYPATQRISKQMLPLYDKPLIYYPITMLMRAGIKDIIIVVNEENYELFKSQLCDGSQWGIKITIIIDYKPQGTAEGLLCAKEYVDGERICFVLGDNFFYGKQFDDLLKFAVNEGKGNYLFGYPVKNPTQFGVATLDKKGNVTSLEEKPKVPKSNLAVTGIYVYDENAISYAKTLSPSDRGEYEVTDLNNVYLSKNNLELFKLSKKNYWLDAGTADGMFEASKKIKNIQKRTQMPVGCPEVEAYKQGFIDKKQLEKLYNNLNKSEYGKFLKKYL